LSGNSNFIFAKKIPDSSANNLERIMEESQVNSFEGKKNNIETKMWTEKYKPITP